TTFTNADQTSPIRTFIAADGNSATPNIDVASAVNDMVLDTVAFGPALTVNSLGGVQVQQWVDATAGASSNIAGLGSSSPGAPSVAMTETLSGSARWTDAAVSIRAMQADVGISITGSSALFPTNLSYTVTVTNNGPSGATGVVLTDTLPNGLTFVSSTATQGSCSGTAPITCNLGTILSQANAVVTITATPSAPGSYTDSAVVKATTTDLNTSNDSATGVAFSEFAACASTPGGPGGTLTGVINTYYPGLATAAAGSTSISVDAAHVAGAGTPIAAGDLVLIIQMQDAAINSSNSQNYGDGSSGSGSTNLNNSGVYEYATATSLVGNTLSVNAAGPTGGLLYTYTAASASSTQGARSFQVIRVPNYTTATLGANLTASAWNGQSGGVLALNVSGTLTLGGATVHVDGLGFRGGAGLQLNGNATGATNTDYRYTAPATYTGTVTSGADGAKGEGIAGTPRWVESGATFLSTNQTSYPEGYPLGSMGRGAPGNAGGGGTDGDPAVLNDQNTGGGGGGNGGAGGQGGNSWNSNLAAGGLGGSAFPATITRVVMGGGGGAATRNNSDGDNQASSAAAGGGIIMIRAGDLSGAATLTTNGSNAYNNTANDGGGGGGAGGTIIVLSALGHEGGLTLQARGGTGGNAWGAQPFSTTDRHGPGGGGGGGVVLLSGAPASSDVSGGANGTTLNTPGVPYGATAGLAGFTLTNLSSPSSPGPVSASSCSDLSITKTGPPNPVLQNSPFTYTVTVRNLGPSTATTVVAVDILPSQVSFQSVSTTAGSCSQSGGVVTCKIASMASGATVTITIVVIAVTPSVAVNTAIVNSATPDPVLSNNTVTISTIIEYPNAVRMNSFTATNNGNSVVLAWRTGGEVHNLGFNLYREVAGQKARLNDSLIAGSGLLMRQALEQHAAKAYAWIDPSPLRGGLYWLEDIDVSGIRTLHGPITVENNAALPGSLTGALTVRQLLKNAPAQVGVTTGKPITSPFRETVVVPRISPQKQTFGFELASRAAVKIYVDHEGWYRVTQPELVRAGLASSLDPRLLHLFAEGVEQPIRITGASVTFGPQAAIEFYGTPIDTPYSGQRVYWLAAKAEEGRRIQLSPAGGSSGPRPLSFMANLRLSPRTTYFAALLQADRDNFFGSLISPAVDVETAHLSHVAPGPGVLEVELQGVTLGQEHEVTVAINGTTLGDLHFTGQEEGKARFLIPDGSLVNGANSISLIAQQGDNDLSLVDYIDLSFPHSFTAEGDMLRFTAGVGQSVWVNGFNEPPVQLLDITNPAEPFEVPFQTRVQGAQYSLGATIPWATNQMRTLLAVSAAQVMSPAAIAAHWPSTLHAAQKGADLLILTASAFAAEVLPLAQLRRSEGYLVSVVNIDEVYDEYNFGERTPDAIRAFLRGATQSWTHKPHYLLLNGNASLDPRNYLGFGFLDFVPTKIVATSELMTASDDWFSDFDGTGFAQIATGRLPARTSGDDQTMVAKIVGYATAPGGSWTNQSMLVADSDDPTVSFSQNAKAVENLLPATMKISDIFVGSLGGGTARQEVLAGINNGQLMVNYNGHGSVQVWANDVLDDLAASSLTNGDRLPVFFMMNCLNGFFDDVYTESLAQALMLARAGGAVAVWASSGLTVPDPQFQMDQALVRTLFSQPGTRLGDGILLAKSGISDPDVRKTFILFGDPLMQLKWNQSGPAVH
ncbi:MAG: DUF11 domain-containing protein, partial [Acidobacteria bacterium]|nr:DUF11 domain-containing protein [Acidobacteriota bacterium]